MSQEELKSSGVDLLKMEDMTAKSADGRPLVGWHPTRKALGALVNSKGGWAMLRTVVWKMIHGIKRKLYDQVILVEDHGVYVVLLDEEGNVGLVESERNIGPRLFPTMGKGFVKRLDDEGLWDKQVARFGRMTWEVPMGITRVNSATEEGLALDGGRDIAYRETGAIALHGMAVAVPYLWAHPVFIATGQPVVVAVVDTEKSMVGQSHDLRMTIGRFQFFSPEEVQGLIEAGTLVDMKTIAALAVCGVDVAVPRVRGFIFDTIEDAKE